MNYAQFGLFACELIENMEEGFHGTSYEMTEGLIAIDASLFVGEYDGDNDDDADDIAGYRANQLIMQDMYERVAYDMIAVASDATRIEMKGSTIRKNFSIDISREIVTAIIDDLCLALSCVDELHDSPFDREFFEKHR